MSRKQNLADFELMAGAFAQDQKMAAQVCRLLVERGVNQEEARMMLRLVMDGRLRSEIQWTFTPWTYTYPSSGTITVSNTSLTSMAEAVVLN